MKNEVRKRGGGEIQGVAEPWGQGGENRGGGYLLGLTNINIKMGSGTLTPPKGGSADFCAHYY